ncbi:hypothetical protein MAPG_03546 [Magnaporthiopsis poae ATCC 64411]|uniref:Uncharacterized protein n=1 Tax=Magnaporthiopsis poae (strain ATCC 64411 / 73-15) TaxID=644358 RepID=A0A0C4DUA9_MAGP6|nr:hypothetical protein MAPG_03546 [Magnaporthiopsis poae ATCC 64411]
MAYARHKKSGSYQQRPRYGTYGRSWNTNYFKGTRKYGKSRYSGKKFRIGGSVNKTLASKIEKLEREAKYGPSERLQFNVAQPSEQQIVFYASGAQAVAQNISVPITGLLRRALQHVGRNVGWFTGVRLEFDVIHAQPMKLKVLCFEAPQSVGTGYYDVECNSLSVVWPRTLKGHSPKMSGQDPKLSCAPPSKGVTNRLRSLSPKGCTPCSHSVQSIHSVHGRFAPLLT